MRRLNRDPVPPQGLGNYRHGAHRWSLTSPSAEERGYIWAKLDAMQGERCAYCEASIDRANRHIEHFRQRHRHPQGTFDWHNLFGSCNRHEHKDSCGVYPHQDLIKPDVENPEDYLVFTPNGSVQPRAHLNTRARNRAEQTIRILELNGALTQIRKVHTSGYLQTALEIAELAQHCAEEDWLAFLHEELQNIANLPFATAIKHVLTRQGE